jgi:hypothetical protein
MMDPADRDLFAASVRNAVEGHSGAALDVALVELGWCDALALDAQTAVSLLFELQGATNTSSAAIDDVLGSALGLPRPGPDAVVLPPLGRWHPPGQIRDGRLVVRGLATATSAQRATLQVVATAEDGEVAAAARTADLTLRRVEGIDPRLALVEVAGDTEATGTPIELAPGQWSQAVALAHLALGHELVGAARKMLELARAHARERNQFGQPISAFQAVRHRLADTLVAIEAADAMLTSAWMDGSAETAAMAKALAGRGAQTGVRHCQQVLAGIGFTAEHEFHHYVRRVFVLDQLFGTALSLTRDLGRQLLHTRKLMALPPL